MYPDEILNPIYSLPTSSETDTCLQQDKAHYGGYLVAKPIDINLTSPEAVLSASISPETLFVLAGIRVAACVSGLVDFVGL